MPIWVGGGGDFHGLAAVCVTSLQPAWKQARSLGQYLGVAALGCGWTNQCGCCLERPTMCQFGKKKTHKWSIERPSIKAIRLHVTDSIYRLKFHYHLTANNIHLAIFMKIIHSYNKSTLTEELTGFVQTLFLASEDQGTSWVMTEFLQMASQLQKGPPPPAKKKHLKTLKRPFCTRQNVGYS